MWARALAGIVAGFFLAAALTGLGCWLAPSPWQQALVPSLVAFIPLWMAAATAAFAFGNGRRAWTGLGLAAVAGFALLWLLRGTGLAQ